MAKTATRVLVVDDDSVLRDTLEEVLVDGGYEVESASNGLEALSILPGWGAVETVHKPFELDDLLNKIRNAVRK
jgi:DNA-binding response OmpR family regulator